MTIKEIKELRKKHIHCDYCWTGIDFLLTELAKKNKRIKKLEETLKLEQLLMDFQSIFGGDEKK